MVVVYILCVVIGFVFGGIVGFVVGTLGSNNRTWAFKLEWGEK